jgi:hypothetical protein
MRQEGLKGVRRGEKKRTTTPDEKGDRRPLETALPRVHRGCTETQKRGDSRLSTKVKNRVATRNSHGKTPSSLQW